MVNAVTVRLDDEQLAEVDETVALLTQQASGAHISRATGLKAIILKGVAAIRAESKSKK